MGRDAMSVVGGDLKVHGVDNLRVADASIMPRVTTGNTMAPCVIIGERAAALIRGEHRIASTVTPTLVGTIRNGHVAKSLRELVELTGIEPVTS
jgi:choline dehydrogenase-like flavoprotein